MPMCFLKRFETGLGEQRDHVLFKMDLLGYPSDQYYTCCHTVLTQVVTICYSFSAVTMPLAFTMESPLLEWQQVIRKYFWAGRERKGERERREREGGKGGRKRMEEERERKEEEMLIELDLKHKAKQATDQKNEMLVSMSLAL